MGPACHKESIILASGSSKMTPSMEIIRVSTLKPTPLLTVMILKYNLTIITLKQKTHRVLSQYKFKSTQ